MLKYLNILTTAVPRYNLHKECLIPTVQTLINNDYDINWFINLDILDHFTEVDVNMTCYQFRSISPRINIFLNCCRKPKFSQAFHKIIETCNKNIDTADNNIFFILEDDWQPYKSTFPLFCNKILDFFDNQFSFLYGGNHPFLTLCPTVFRQDFFLELIRAQAEEPLDSPEEHFIATKQKYFKEADFKTLLNKYPTRYDRIRAFYDVGRAYASKNNIKKNYLTSNNRAMSWLKK